MQLHELDRYFRDIMRIDEFAAVDSSLNGVQVGDMGARIHRVAFAVDACMETFRRAVDAGAGLLFVHHGLFWGKDIRVVKSHYRRLEFLLTHNCALYASHLPLDAHPEFGNNAALAGRLELKDTVPFGRYHGVDIGLKGILATPLGNDAVVEKLKFDRDACAAVFRFGKKENTTVAVVSGGAIGEVEQAIDADADLYLTGEMSHSYYHLCLEEKINLICGGHYQTETLGVSLLSEKLKRETGLETLFIDVPTGL
ncbi:MAG: Nif3-like dinuclear metal center hexameric protein [Spirochaetales bacterium]|nr:Nif3-like dinuclear metal center hexameric protein [Spirochaetales bacterium]